MWWLLDRFILSGYGYSGQSNRWGRLLYFVRLTHGYQPEILVAASPGKTRPSNRILNGR
jgi:hypothetical protein